MSLDETSEVKQVPACEGQVRCQQLIEAQQGAQADGCR
jgi:hypothetical protein